MTNENAAGFSGKNDVAWQLLFQNPSLSLMSGINGSDHCCKITAAQIAEIGRREPRLMTKFDHKINLPQVFQDHRLAILPVTRGDYLIGRFNAYNSLNPNGFASTALQTFDLPSHLETMRPEFISSEAMAINCACASGILDDFIGDGTLYSTVNGRMTSDKMEYDIDIFLNEKSTDTVTKHIVVTNSQMEIDAGYESDSCLTLIEAKRDLADDFLVRQLFYPYCRWKQAIGKQIRTVFLVYSDSIFHLYEYGFSDDYYNSLKLLRYKKYQARLGIKADDVQEIAAAVQTVDEPEIPFPQANSMERVVNLLELLNDNAMTKDEITENYAFTDRQTNYYTDAARYLGLATKNVNSDGDIEFALSDEGSRIMRLAPAERQAAIIAAIFKHKAFRDSFTNCLGLDPLEDNVEMEKRIVVAMRNAHLYNVEADSTFHRRASTVKQWLEWIKSKQNG